VTNYGGPSKVKQRVKLTALILLAVVSLSFAVFALVERPKQDGSPPNFIQEIMRNGPKLQ